MKLSYFSYDFSECCCEAVNDGVCVGIFRCASAVLLAVCSTACLSATRFVRPGCSMRPPSTPGSFWSLCVPVGGGPPARSPHASLTARSGRSRGPPWPCRHPPAPRPSPPAPFTPVGPGRCSAALRVGLKPGQAPPPPTGTAARPLLGPRPSHAKPSHPALTSHIPEPTPNFACNSPNTTSNLELRSLELQRFRTMLKLLPIELHATFLGQTHNTTTDSAAWPPHPRLATRARKSSPCSPPSAHTREKVRPAPPKLPKISAFSPAGRTFSRFVPESTPAGRTFSR